MKINNKIALLSIFMLNNSLMMASDSENAVSTHYKSWFNYITSFFPLTDSDELSLAKEKVAKAKKEVENHKEATANIHTFESWADLPFYYLNQAQDELQQAELEVQIIMNKESKNKKK